MSSVDQTKPYARRDEPAQGVGAPIRTTQTGYLDNGREPLGLSDKALGFVIGACVVAGLGLFVLAIFLTAQG
jgi:hypothetical protein